MKNEELLTKIHLVVEKLIHLGGGDYGKDKMVDDGTCSKGLIQRDVGIEEWDWPQGIGLYGLYKLQGYYGDKRYMEFFENWYATNLKVGLPSKNINTTAPLLPLINIFEEMKEPEIYRQICTDRANWLIDELPKTKDAGFQHVTSAIRNRNDVMLHEGQLWVDTLVMAVLFLNEAGRKFGNLKWIEEALHQFLIHIKYLYEKKTGLFYHGWSFEKQDNFGNIFWCRGNSWYTFGVMDYIQACGDNLNKGSKQFLTDTYKAQVDKLAELQAPSGLWHTVLTDASSYEEVSGSAAITAGILKGIKLGILEDSFKNVAEKALAAICANVKEDGTVLNVSAGTGMGMNEEHYKNIAIRPMAYGQSLTLIALCEALTS